MAPGLILFVGSTGSGKSTSLASMIDYRNANAGGHIITIEDPIEFVHSHKQSVVNQREVGMDTDNYQDALENTAQSSGRDSDWRDSDLKPWSIIAFAETGHLCLSTLTQTMPIRRWTSLCTFSQRITHSCCWICR